MSLVCGLQKSFGLDDEAFANECVDGSMQCRGDVGPSSVPPEEAASLEGELVSVDAPGISNDVPHRELCLRARDLRHRPLRQLVASRHSDYLQLARVGVRIRHLQTADQAAETQAFHGALECLTDPMARASHFPPCLADTPKQELVLDGTLDVDNLHDHPPEI